MISLKRTLLLIIAAVPAALASSITLLTPPAGYTTGYAVGINDNGQIAMAVYTNGGALATALYTGGVYTDLNAGEGKGNGDNEATSINSAGTMSTVYFTGTAEIDAGAVTSGGTFTPLKTLSGTTGSYANFLNNSGIVVGDSFTQTTKNNVTAITADKAVAWIGTGNGAPGSSTTPTTLGSFSSGAFSRAWGINSPSIAANYEIVGTAGATDDSMTDGYAFFYTKTGGMQYVPGLQTTYSDAYAVNNAGQIAGDEVNSSTGDTQAYVYTPGSGVVEYGTLGDANSTTNAIDSSGIAVGMSYNLDSEGDYIDTIATVFMDSVATDLNSYLPANSGWILEDALGINDSGQIVGYGLYNGAMEGFELDIGGSSTPEPASMLLFGSGIALIAAARKFRLPRGLVK
jgi:probable HAF family extracellular repeat protein